MAFESVAQCGYVETSRDGRTLYKVKNEDRQMLLALRRFGVGKDQQGHIRINASPDILAQLRRQSSIVESERSAQVRVADTPTLPALTIDYMPGQGTQPENWLR